jgi:hypothetical protein
MQLAEERDKSSMADSSHVREIYARARQRGATYDSNASFGISDHNHNFVVMPGPLWIGINDGPLGSQAPTRHKMRMAFCEIARFDKQGRIVAGSCYYDQYTLLAQQHSLSQLQLSL